MVVTCEPGIYFYPSLLGPAFKDPTQSKYLNKELLEDTCVNVSTLPPPFAVPYPLGGVSAGPLAPSQRGARRVVVAEVSVVVGCCC